MRLARVVGSVVATRKQPALTGARLLIAQPLDAGGVPAGDAHLAIDAVGAGPGETVLLVLEGRAAGAALGRPGAPVDAAIVGIVDPCDPAVSCPEPHEAARAVDARWTRRRQPSS